MRDALRAHFGAMAPAEAPTAASSPARYQPIDIGPPETCGPLDPAGVMCTRVAREIAERLLDGEGRLRTDAIAAMIGQLEQDRVLPADYREHVVHTLQRLQRDERLAAQIHAIGGERLMGPAADLVRATLNLRYCDWRLGARDQRKAVLVALLGHLRQKPAESSIATGIALCVQRDPLTCVADLALLVRQGKLLLRRPAQGHDPAGGRGAVMEIPMPAHASHAGADVKLVVRDGMCHGIAGAPGAAPCRLHEVPGMQAALTAIEMRESEWEYAISQALEKMGAHPAGRQHEISCGQLLEQLIPAGSGTNALLLKAALDAFASARTPALLDAWHHTLTVAAQREQHGWHLSDLQNAVRNAAYSVLWPRTGPAWSRMRQDLTRALSDQMAQRLCHEYHPSLQGAGSGYRASGGYALFYRRSAGDPGRSRVADHADFREAMQEMLAAAKVMVERDLAARAGMPEDERGDAADDARTILAAMTEDLRRHFDSVEFIRSIIDEMNVVATQELDMHGSVARVIEGDTLGWRQRREAPPAELIACYGGMPVRVAVPKMQPRPVAGATAPDDAEPMLRRFLSGVQAQRRSLRAWAAHGNRAMVLPASIDSHVFPLLLAPLYRVLVEQGGTPDDWIAAHLVEPAIAHRHDRRSDDAPATLIGDSTLAENGQPVCLAVSYNVKRRQVEASWMSRDGSRRMPLDNEMLRGTCRIWTPLGARPPSPQDRLRHWLRREFLD